MSGSGLVEASTALKSVIRVCALGSGTCGSTVLSNVKGRSIKCQYLCRAKSSKPVLLFCSPVRWGPVAFVCPVRMVVALFMRSDQVAAIMKIIILVRAALVPSGQRSNQLSRSGFKAKNHSVLSLWRELLIRNSRDHHVAAIVPSVQWSAPEIYCQAQGQES